MTLIRGTYYKTVPGNQLLQNPDIVELAVNMCEPIRSASLLETERSKGVVPFQAQVLRTCSKGIGNSWSSCGLTLSYPLSEGMSVDGTNYTVH